MEFIPRSQYRYRYGEKLDKNLIGNRAPTQLYRVHVLHALLCLSIANNIHRTMFIDPLLLWHNACYSSILLLFLINFLRIPTRIILLICQQKNNIPTQRIARTKYLFEYFCLIFRHLHAIHISYEYFPYYFEFSVVRASDGTVVLIRCCAFARNLSQPGDIAFHLFWWFLHNFL